MKKCLYFLLTTLTVCFNQISLANLCRASGTLPNGFNAVDYQQCKQKLSRCRQKKSPILSPHCVTETMSQTSCNQFKRITSLLNYNPATTRITKLGRTSQRLVTSIATGDGLSDYAALSAQGKLYRLQPNSNSLKLSLQRRYPQGILIFTAPPKFTESSMGGTLSTKFILKNGCVACKTQATFNYNLTLYDNGPCNETLKQADTSPLVKPTPIVIEH